MPFNVHVLAAFSGTLSWLSLTRSRFYPFDLLPWLGTLTSFLALEDGLLVKWWFYPHWSV